MIYGYLRLSTNETAQKNSFEVQRQAITSKYDVPLANFYSDTISGSTPFDKRPAWVELMKLVKEGDQIIVHRLDRLSRDTLHYLVVEQMLEKLGVELVFIEGVSGSDPMSKMIRQILAAVSELERSMIRTRTKQTKALQKSQGKYLGGSVPYGFDRVGNHLEENETEQEIIRIMQFERINGLSYGGIANKLNAKGYRARSSGGFTAMSVSRALKYNQSSKITKGDEQ